LRLWLREQRAKISRHNDTAMAIDTSSGVGMHSPESSMMAVCRFNELLPGICIQVRACRCLVLERPAPLPQLAGAGLDGYILFQMPMPSANYRLFEQAMRMRKQIVCVYDGYPRELCPIILGHSQEHEKVLTYQFGGQSKSGLPPQGQWRCLFLSKVSNVQLREGPWISGASHTQPQGCVEIVDLDVNPQSPYHPKRRAS